MRLAGAALVCLALTCLQLACGAAHYPLNPPAIRRVLERLMRCQSVPQLHAAVVHASDVIFSIRLEKLANGEIRDINDTRLLYLASVTKGMFGTALVRVEEYLRNELKNQSFSLFTTPIKQLIGDENFWFIDHGLTEMVTIDDMLSHRTGLSRHDSMWYMNEWESKEDLAKHVGRLKTSAPFRSSFVYNNLVWTIADVVVQRLTKRSFVQYMREFLWQPLGMTDTYGVSEIKQRRLLERVDINRHHKPLGLPLDMSQMAYSTRFVEAAGGILTSLEDMTRYMRLHASVNHSAYSPLPGQFQPLNADSAVAGWNAVFNPLLYNSSVVSDLPDWEIESYSRGWLRSWHRRHLDYSHGGSLLGVRCELDILPNQNLAVFNHMTLGPADITQGAYASIVNRYLADLLLRNHSFATEENVCELFNRIPIDPRVETIQRRKLDESEISLLSGSYGNYGFGVASMSYNRTADTMTIRYGIARLELIPVALRPEPQPYHFFVNLLEPREMANSGSLLNRTDSAIAVPWAVRQNPMSFLTVRPDSVNASQLVIESAIVETGTLLVKGLDPSTWAPPKLCPDKVLPKSAIKFAASASAAVTMVIAAWAAVATTF